MSEYVEGPTLEQHLARHGPLDHENLVAFAAGVAEALSAIHAAGLVHRDLKPSNVILSAEGPKVLDFGVTFDTTAATLTVAGETLGSPGWMAPEQARGARTTAATDVFSWGMVVAAAGTTRNPFGTGTADALVYRVVHEQPNLEGLDPTLIPTVAAALSKAPSDRPNVGQLLN